MHRMRHMTIKSRGKLRPVPTKCSGVAVRNIEGPFFQGPLASSPAVQGSPLPGGSCLERGGTGGRLERPAGKPWSEGYPGQEAFGPTSLFRRGLGLPGKGGILGTAEAANGWNAYRLPTWPPPRVDRWTSAGSAYGQNATMLTWILNWRKLVTSCGLDRRPRIAYDKGVGCICRNCRRGASPNMTVWAPEVPVRRELTNLRIFLHIMSLHTVPSQPPSPVKKAGG